VRRPGHPAPNDANARQGRGYNICQNASILSQLRKGTLQLVAADSRYCRRRTGRCCDPTDQYIRALVSLLIPAYNAEEWVGTAIGSALGQTWRQKEIMVVDDGSTDGTLAVARQFGSNEVR
jgi:cellulose synthase/poly-beta-1,6-N-acetylglucosamine synthase-like glycosyltransferase